jgi:hypothetical protein
MRVGVAGRPPPDLEVTTTRELAGRAWNTSEGEVSYRSGTWQSAVAYWAAAPA